MGTEREIEVLISYLKDKPISQEQEKYLKLISSVHSHPNKNRIISNIISNIDSPTVFLGIVPAYFRIETEEDSTSTMLLIQKSTELCTETGTNYDLLCRILFKCLEMKKTPIEVKSAVFKILEETEFDLEWIQTNAFSMMQHEHTTSIITEIVLYISALNRCRRLDGEISPVNSAMLRESSPVSQSVLSETLRYLLINSETSKNSTLQKNYSNLICRVCESVRTEGVMDTIEPLLESITSEIQCIRNAATESAVTVSKGLKKKIEEERKGEKELDSILTAVVERTVDVSPFCRSRAIQTLTEILENNGLLEGMKERVYEAVHGRIMDKTQIVRRKAIVFFKKSLETHPYSLDGGTLSMERLEKHKETEPQYYKSASIFYKAIYQTVQTVKDLLRAGSKGEASEIVQYVSLCYTYGVNTAIDLFPDLFLFAWQRIPIEGRSISDVISEELRKMADGSPKKLIELLVYLDSDSLSYEGIIRELTLRGILGIEAVNTLYNRIDREEEKMPYLRLLRRISATDRSVTEGALTRMTDIIRSSRGVKMQMKQAENTDESTGNMKIDNNTNDTTTYNPGVISEAVRILGNIDYRVGNTSEVIQTILGTLSIVDEDRLELLQSVIDTSYLISTDPDGLAVEILDRLGQIEKTGPMIFAVGHIAIKEAVHLERVEAAWNHQTKPAGQKRRKESISNPEIRERRLSVGSRRNSLKNTTEEQEEMADRIFFAKEHEILFGETSALKGGPELAGSGLSSRIEHIKRVSLLSLGKMMSVSSECSTRYMSSVVEVLREGPSDMQIIALVIISDSIMAFSSLVKDASESLFIPLKKGEKEVKKTALVLIRHLLRSGMVKVKENYWTLGLLLLEEPEIRNTAQKLFEEACERETAMKVVCEVIKSYLIERHSHITARTDNSGNNEKSKKMISDNEQTGQTEKSGKMGQTEQMGQESNLDNPEQTGQVNQENDNVTKDPNQMEQPEQAGNSEQMDQPYNILSRVIKALVRAVPVSDFSRKIMDWGGSKNDPVISEMCSYIAEEVSSQGKCLVNE